MPSSPIPSPPPIDAVAGTPSLRTLGTGAQQAAAGNDSRFLTTGAQTITGLKTFTNGITSGDIIRVVKLATGSLPAPNAGNEGAIAYDDTTNTLKVSNGSAWVEPGAGGGGITGTGTAGRVMLWSGSSVATSDSDLTYNSTTNILTANGGYQFGDGTLMTTAAEQLYGWSTIAQTAETEGRHFFTSNALVKLGDGRFFVVGNPSGAGSTTSEIINATATASAASGTPTASRTAGVRMCLLNNGTVLVAGGLASPLTSETWDPGTGLFTARGACVFISGGGLVALNDGNAVSFGGHNSGLSFGSQEVDTTQIYDATAFTWSTVSSMIVGRSGFGRVVKIAGGTKGRVFVAGGAINSGDQTTTSEVFDADTNTWTAKASMAVARGDQAVCLLPNGRVMHAGGVNTFGNTVTGTVEIYDPVGNAWATVGSLNAPRLGAHAVALPDGRVIIAGGIAANGNDTILPTEIYTPATGQWTILADGFFGGSPAHNTYGADLQILGAGTLPTDVVAIGGIKIPFGTEYLRDIRQLKVVSLTSKLAAKNVKATIDAQGSTPFVYGTNYNSSLAPGKHWIIQSPDPGFGPLLQVYADTSATTGVGPLNGQDGGVVLGGAGLWAAGGANWFDGPIYTNYVRGRNGVGFPVGALQLIGDADNVAGAVGVIIDNTTSITDTDPTTVLLSIRNGGAEKAYFTKDGKLSAAGVYLGYATFAGSDPSQQTEPFVVRHGYTRCIAGQTILNGNTDPLAFDTVVSDIGNLTSHGFSASTSVYDAPNTGYYEVTVSIAAVASAGGGTNATLSLRVNGSPVEDRIVTFMTSGATQQMILHAIVFCGTSDTIDATLFANGDDFSTVGIETSMIVKSLGYGV